MTKLIKTNPAYAALAYRKTVLSTAVEHLRREYIGLDTDPKATMLCEEVFQVDSKVPIEEVGYVIEDLIDEIEELRLEMSKFEFEKREYVSKRRKDKKRKPQESKSAGQSSKEKGPGNG